MVIETFGNSSSARETQHAKWRYTGVHPSAYHYLDYDALVFMQKFEQRRRVFLLIHLSCPILQKPETFANTMGSSSTCGAAAVIWSPVNTILYQP